MILRVDGERKQAPESVELEVLLAQIESNLLRENRLVDRVVIGDETYWTLSEATASRSAPVEHIEIHSRPVPEYVREVCETAIEYVGRLSAGLVTCAELWQDGKPDLAKDKWTDAIDGLQWITTVGAQIAHLVTDETWATALADLHECLIPIERAMGDADWLQAGDIVRYELTPAVEKIGAWFEDRRSRDV